MTGHPTNPDDLAARLALAEAEVAAMRALLERLDTGTLAHPQRAIRVTLTRCDDWRAGRLPVGQVRP